MELKGRFKNLLAAELFKFKVMRSGVSLHDFSHSSPSKTSILVSGEKEKVWDLVKKAPHQSIFFNLNEVAFEFID